MKKLVTALALCAAVSAAYAAPVESANIVGYATKSTLANTLDMVGVGFQNPGTNTISIQSIVPVSGFNLGGVDFLRIWNPLTQGYSTYYYYGVTYLDTTYGTTLAAGWGDVNQIRVNVTLEPGQGFWLKTQAVASFTVSGEVIAPTSNQISTLANTLDMVAGVFPVTMSIQDLVPVSGVSLGGVDFVRVWNPVTQGYSTYYYYGVTYLDTTYGTTLAAGWGDVNQIRVNVTIEQGKGFWLKTQANAVLSFTSPF